MITTRVAKDEDIPRFKELMSGTGYEWLTELDWDGMQTWMVVEDDGVVEGFIQIFMGKPTAHLEHLVMREDLHHVKKAKLFKILFLTAMAALRNSGAQMVIGTVPFELKGYKKMLKKRGGFVALSGNMIATRLTWEAKPQLQ